MFEDEKLGEGAFGIVRKGKYRAKNGQILDVAVKQLKGDHIAFQTDFSKTKLSLPTF